jgi:sugar lactone lactonase YvrE
MARTTSIEVDTLNHQVLVGVVPRGKRGSAKGEFHYPSSVAVFNGRAYVADSWNHRIQVFDLPEWRFAFEFGDFFCPRWIGVVHDHGKPLLFIVDSNNARLCWHEPGDGRRAGIFDFRSRRFPVSAQVLDSETIEVVFEDDHREVLDIESLIRPPFWTTRLDKPISIVRDVRGFVYVSDYGRRTVEKFSADGAFVGEVLGPDVLTLPGKMVMNGDDLLVADRPANAVFVYNTVNQSARKWEHTFDAPGFIGRSGAGEIWAGTYTMAPDPAGAKFEVFTSGYRFLRTVIFSDVHQPTSIAFAGNRILIADQAARNVMTYRCDYSFAGTLRDQPYDVPVWSVSHDGIGQVYVGAGPIVDLLSAPDLNRLYYIDFESAAIRYNPLEG